MNNLTWMTNGPQGVSRIDEPFLFGAGLNTPQDFFRLLLPLVLVALTLACASLDDLVPLLRRLAEPSASRPGHVN